MTGRSQVLALAAIVEASRIPIKISTILTEQNIHEIPEIIARCRNLGISRIVLRKLIWRDARLAALSASQPTRCFGGNPVYDLDGMEVTVWDFARSGVCCLNLFSDGSISVEYQLTRKMYVETDVLTYKKLDVSCYL
jgi:hypothetical protein